MKEPHARILLCWRNTRGPSRRGAGPGAAGEDDGSWKRGASRGWKSARNRRAAGKAFVVLSKLSGPARSGPGLSNACVSVLGEGKF